jgi:hypothetical protein
LKIKFKSRASSRRGVRNLWSFEASRYRITLIATDNSSVCPPFRLTRVTSARLAHEAGCTSPRPTHARSTLDAAMVATMSSGGGSGLASRLLIFLFSLTLRLHPLNGAQEIVPCVRLRERARPRVCASAEPVVSITHIVVSALRGLHQ